MRSGTLLRAVVLSLALVFAAGCTGQAGAGAQRGAVTGGISGAVGGLLGSLVFGGSAVEGAVGGAVVGMGAGATAGAIAGAEQDRQLAAARQAEIDAFRARVGDDNFNGAVALVQCRHDDALAEAAKAAQSGNPEYRLASNWLKALTFTDHRQEAQARSLYPALVDLDPDIGSTDSAELKMRDLVQRLTTVRASNNLPQICPA